MTWLTIQEAVRRGPSADAWEGRARAGEVASYVDPRGRRWVWVEAQSGPVDPWQLQDDLQPVWEQVASLRREVVALRRRLAEAETEPVASIAPSPEPAPFEPVLAIRLADPAPAPDPAEPDPEEILALYEARWRGSDRELERQAGLPKAFLAKAKKGRRGGPRSQASWQRLEAFLRGLDGQGAARRAA